MKALDGCLQQAKAPVIAVEPHIFAQAFHAGKYASVPLLREDFQLRGFVQDHLGTKVPKEKSNGFTEVSVGRVSNERGTGV
jgi:hypothetical protein